MKKQKKKNPYQEKLTWDSTISLGEMAHEIGRKMTEKVVKSKRDYTRKKKHKNKSEEAGSN